MDINEYEYCKIKNNVGIKINIRNYQILEFYYYSRIPIVTGLVI